MEIVGSVAPDEVPEGIRPAQREGVWSAVCKRVVADHEQQRVTVLKLKDQKEYMAMMNNIVPRLRKLGYRARPVRVQQGDELRVYLELALREAQATQPVNNGMVGAAV